MLFVFRPVFHNSSYLLYTIPLDFSQLWFFSSKMSPWTTVCSANGLISWCLIFTQTYPFFYYAVVRIYTSLTSFFNASTLSPKQKVSTLAPPSISSVKSAILLQLLSTHVLQATGSPRLLFLSFNGYIFYRLSDILVDINHYLDGLQQIELYYDVAK